MPKKNKQTQTMKPFNEYAYEEMPINAKCQYYLEKEDKLYKQACRQKRIRIDRDIDMTHEAPNATQNYLSQYFGPEE